MNLRPYVIRQGESWATLSILYGFDMEAVWNMPANASIRRLRDDPHVLAPLDVVYIPEERQKDWLPVSVGEKNVFVGEVLRLHGSIRCMGADGRPLADAAFTLRDVSPAFKGTTTGDGIAEFSFPCSMSVVHLDFDDLGLVVVAHVAQLDPISTPSGVRQRLEGLGVIPPMPIVPDARARAMLAEYVMIAALRRFQSDQGIEVTGELDGATIDALRNAYGA